MDLLYSEIHVIWRRDIRSWCARSLVGDYGISEDRRRAISIAVDAVVTTGHPYKRVVVFTKRGRREVVLKNFRKLKPSPQFYQDAVP